MGCLLSLHPATKSVAFLRSTPQKIASGRGIHFPPDFDRGAGNTSKIVGRAQGFIIPLQHFAHSEFNIIYYLTFDTVDYFGSLIIEAKELAHEDMKELPVVGGIGDFAFARGKAIFMQTRGEFSDVNSNTCNVKLHLRFANRSRTMPG